MSKNCDFIECLSSSIKNGSCRHEQTQGVGTLLRFVNSVLICHEAPDARRVRRERPMSRKLRVLLKVVMKLLWTARSRECDRGAGKANSIRLRVSSEFAL